MLVAGALTRSSEQSKNPLSLGRMYRSTCCAGALKRRRCLESQLTELLDHTGRTMIAMSLCRMSAPTCRGDELHHNISCAFALSATLLPCRVLPLGCCVRRTGSSRRCCCCRIGKAASTGQRGSLPRRTVPSVVRTSTVLCESTPALLTARSDLSQSPDPTCTSFLRSRQENPTLYRSLPDEHLLVRHFVVLIGPNSCSACRSFFLAQICGHLAPAFLYLRTTLLLVLGQHFCTRDQGVGQLGMPHHRMGQPPCLGCSEQRGMSPDLARGPYC